MPQNKMATLLDSAGGISAQGKRLFGGWKGLAQIDETGPSVGAPKPVLVLA
jgi:hypothetical protein